MNAPLYLQQFPDDLQWVNTATPPTLSSLRGRATLLWFFTGSSVHCQADLAELKALESRFPDGVSIIGVHQPRYPVEADSARVLKTLNRWFLRYPVINDREFVLWRLFGVTAWPTSVLLDAEGRLAGVYPGRDRRAEIEARINVLLDDAANRDLRTFEAAPQARKPETRTPVAFPTGLTASDQFVYVADTGRNRVLELTHEGRIARVFGASNAGLWDGRLTEAGFNAPQGLALGKDALYVADTGNHALRRIRLLTGEVDTIAGTGKPASGALESGLPRTIALNSPTGLAMHVDRLYIAMSGLQQIWLFDLATQALGPWAGNGREDLVDGHAEFASFAQPTGLALGRDTLYVADAGSNSIRVARLLDGTVGTVIEGHLFESGDADGARGARVAGPRALCADLSRNVLWIADSMNGKLKVHALAKAETKTLNLNYPLNEPSGMTMAAGSLWLSNSNSHELLKLDMKTGKLLRVAVSE